MLNIKERFFCNLEHLGLYTGIREALLIALCISDADSIVSLSKAATHFLQAKSDSGLHIYVVRSTWMFMLSAILNLTSHDNVISLCNLLEAPWLSRWKSTV